MTPDFTTARCYIDLEAVGRNFKILGSPKKLMPVIKADAYGHGLFKVAEKLDACGALNFAVGTVSEAVALRNAGYRQTIVPLMGARSQSEWEQIRSNGILGLAGNFNEIEWLASIIPSGQVMEIGLKCDTGMSRLGFNIEDIAPLLDKLSSFPALRPALLISHLACADMPEMAAFTRNQKRQFDAFREAFIDRFPDMKFSLGNSAVTVGDNSLKYDICRPGIVLYGGSPFAVKNIANNVSGSKWAMKICAPILGIRVIKQGDCVSYGAKFRADKTMKIGVIGMGYANGYPRSLSGRTEVMIQGIRVPQIGTICMNMMMIDLSDINNCCEGDIVWIMGGESGTEQESITAQELADRAGTISYELLCNLGSANPRYYL